MCVGVYLCKCLYIVSEIGLGVGSVFWGVLIFVFGKGLFVSEKEKEICSIIVFLFSLSRENFSG